MQQLKHHDFHCNFWRVLTQAEGYQKGTCVICVMDSRWLEQENRFLPPLSESHVPRKDNSSCNPEMLMGCRIRYRRGKVACNLKGGMK